MDEDDWIGDEGEDDWSEDEGKEILLNDFCCPKCEEQNVRVTIYKSEKPDIIDQNFECLSCEHRWWIVNVIQS